jgi:DNA-directed RNA polymerase specialized sigma24 family protein
MKRGSAGSNDVSEYMEQRLDEIVRLLALSLSQTTENQTEAILLLSQANLEPNRIAELVGTTPATVRSTQAKAKGKGKVKAKAKVT